MAAQKEPAVRILMPPAAAEHEQKANNRERAERRADENTVV
jgi:hypothetical protein